LRENGAIHEDDAQKFVAVEASSIAVARLKTQFPGLRVLEISTRDLVHSERMNRWPDGDHAVFCRAQIINLDYNGPLESSERDGQLIFPDLEVVSKLAILHGLPDVQNWRLFLTFKADVVWSEETCRLILKYLKHNFDFDNEFREKSCRFLGDRLVGMIDDTQVDQFVGLTSEECQLILQVLVPKKIVQLSYPSGWSIKTIRNYRYGGGTTARMVTWAFTFEWDVRATSEPQVVYRESLLDVLANVGEIESDGRICIAS
jgi:hypothetical protein